MDDLELRREKARNLRYKKPAVKGLNLYDIREWLEEMSGVCSDVRYFYADGDETMLNELIGDEDDAFELKMMLSNLDMDAQRMLYDLENEWVLECFDDFFAASGAGEDAGMMGYDAYEQDYYGISGYEIEWAEKEARKRMVRMTKGQILDAAFVCLRIATAYIGLRSRFDDLRASLDVLRGNNAGFLQTIRDIERAYERAAEDGFGRYMDSTEALDKMTAALPGEVWLQ